jgi:hypothetical protein
LFVRTGLTPRVAKRILTAREAKEFATYCARYPIDDESNHHIPVANLHTTVANMMGGKTKITDHLVFRKRGETDLDEMLLSGDW